MDTQAKRFSHRTVHSGMRWAAALFVLLLSSATVHAQSGSGTKTSVGILPFDDISGAGISDANVQALARQLRAELIKSGKLTPRMLTLPAGAALPLEPEKAAEVGRAAQVDFVVAPAVVKAQAKPFEKGLRSGRTVFGVPLGGGKARGVSAEVKIQVELIRSADGQRIDTFTVEGKKTDTSVSTDIAGLGTDLGSADAGNPNFQSSPLGEALREALTKLVAEVEARSEKAKSQAAPPPTETPEAGPSGRAVAGQRGQSSEGAVPTAAPPSPPVSEEKERTSGAAAPARRASAGTGERGSSGGGWGLGFRPFSADLITTTGKETHMAKFYATEKAIRMEGEEKGKKAISILRTDRNVMWVLMPDQKMYMEMSLNPGKSFAEAARESEAKIERESLGTEQVGPYHCEKHLVRVTYKGKVYSGLQWAAKELDGFVVKMMDEKTKATTEYQNVRLGPQDPSLFEIPPGYKKLGMPGVKFP